MSQAALESFLGRLITDKDFNAKAVLSLENACRAEGYNISAKEISYLKTIDYMMFSKMAEGLDDAIKRG